MLKAVQILSGLLAAVLLGFAGLYILNPLGASSLNGLSPVDTHGVTNLRVLGAPIGALGLMAAIGAVKKDPVFLAPAALYFLFTILIRVFGLIADGAHSSTIRGLVLAAVLFIVAEIAVWVFRKEQKTKNDPVAA
ncbi:MAG: hypothetical protein GKR98_11965 [Boseongicola sp.]|nr:MAG: hypothetical protein GKR98_11965 [Boseongicola sp.]